MTQRMCPVEERCEGYAEVATVLAETMPWLASHFQSITKSAHMYVVFGALENAGIGELWPDGQGMKFIIKGKGQLIIVKWSAGHSRAIFGTDIITVNIDVYDR